VIRIFRLPFDEARISGTPPSADRADRLAPSRDVLVEILEQRGTLA
jgi:hypothetical protein